MGLGRAAGEDGKERGRHASNDLLHVFYLYGPCYEELFLSLKTLQEVTG